MNIDPSWKEVLAEEFSSPYMRELSSFIKKEREKSVVYPPKEKTFWAFEVTPFDLVKVVIVGQDPYHGQGQAQGLSFSVPNGVKLPPSLKNIYKELSADLGILSSSSGNLLPWAKQGVFLLNTVLTVREKEPGSHQGKGWERFTDAVIDKLLSKPDPIVFLLWGKAAEKKCEKIKEHPRHKALIAAHPSPYSAHNFFGCHHFSKANAFLESVGKEAINWDLACY